MSSNDGTHEHSQEVKIQSLLCTLAAGWSEPELDRLRTLQTLQELKLFSRDSSGSHMIYKLNGIKTLITFAFDTSDDDISREAIRCLANCLFLIEPARQDFVNLGGPEKACRRYKVESVDDEFLSARLLLICTYGTNLNLCMLLESYDLSESMGNALRRHAEWILRPHGCDSTDGSEMKNLALQETLKLLFNITHFAPNQLHLFNSCIPHLFQILKHHELSKPPLRPPINQVVNALLNFDFRDKVPKSYLMENIESITTRLIEILDLSLKFMYENSDNDFESSGAPLLSILGIIYDVAPDTVKYMMQKQLLPRPEERDRPLGTSDTLSARILNLTTSALLPNCRNIAAELLFTLSDRNPYIFIRNVGYGYASGFLVSNNIAIPENALNDDASVIHENDRVTPINPVTGQTLEAEAQSGPGLPHMTEEEKLREAERLFVLFERLRNTGVVQLKNPVEEAIQSGRFEEMD